MQTITVFYLTIASFLGIYNLNTTEDHPLVGKWVVSNTPYTLTIQANGDYVVDFEDDGTAEVIGSAKLEAGSITFNDKSGRMSCPGVSAKYSFQIEGSTATFTLVGEDACNGRKQGMDGGSMERAQ